MECRRKKRARLALVLAALWPGVVHGLAAQNVPPDTVATVFVSDTIPDYGAVGGVVVDGLGYVYVADFRNAVWRLSPDGELAKFADGLYGTSGNAIGPRGYLYQSSFTGSYVARISRTGQVEIYADEGLQGPVGIAASPEGELFVVNCTSGTISRVDRQRRVSEFARHPLMACPNGITFDDRGDLYVVSFNNTKVLRVTPDGTVSEFAEIPGAGGNGHITFARGAFYVTKFRGNQVFRLERDGSFSVLAGTGQPGERDGAAPEATFTNPNGIGASPNGKNLWINDLTHRAASPGERNSVALRRIRLVSLSDVLVELDAATDIGEVERAYHAYRATRPRENTSADAIALGYQWLTAGRLAHAVRVFELNAESYPEDANAQFQAGEAYRYTRRPDRAAEQYRLALSLQPDHPQASARLAEVTQSGLNRPAHR